MEHVIKEMKAVKWRLNDCWTRQLIEQKKPLENITHNSVPKFHSENQLPNRNQPSTNNIPINQIKSPPETITMSDNVSDMSAGTEDLETRINQLYRFIQETEAGRIPIESCVRSEAIPGETRGPCTSQTVEGGVRGTYPETA